MSSKWRSRAWWAVPIATAAVLVSSGPVSSVGTNPQTEPVPNFVADAAADEAKSTEIKVHFTDGPSGLSNDDSASVSNVTVVDERPRSHVGDPPLVKVEVRNRAGAVIETFNDWHPLWQFQEGADGKEERITKPSGDGLLQAKFNREMGTVKIMDGPSGNVLATADLTPATAAWCQSHPSDEDCKRSDMAVTSVTAVAPPIGLVGQTSSVNTTSNVVNLGPDVPENAKVTTTATGSAGLTVTPASAVDNIAGPAVNANKALPHAWNVKCDTAGAKSVTFTSTVVLTHPADVELNPANNTKTTVMPVDCAVPITVNIKPGGDPNSINRGAANVPLAVLTTTAGQYGNPLAFDATKIVVGTARFGARSTVLAGGGAPELHAKRHDEKSYEPDEKTIDADLDAVMHFDPAPGGFLLTSTEGCIKGTFTSGAQTLTYFGCGPVQIIK